MGEEDLKYQKINRDILRPPKIETYTPWVIILPMFQTYEVAAWRVGGLKNRDHQLKKHFL